MNMSQDFKLFRTHLPVLFEDNDIIVINKPHNMLCVPGKEMNTKKTTKKRIDQWLDALKSYYESIKTKDDRILEKILQELIKRKYSVPRKMEKFYKYISRVLGIKDKLLIDEIWNGVNEADISLHKVSYEDIPNHLISASDIASKISGKKIFHVHRLDQETSGLVIFALNENSCAFLGKQFREKSVNKPYN